MDRETGTKERNAGLKDGNYNGGQRMKQKLSQIGLLFLIAAICYLLFTCGDDNQVTAPTQTPDYDIYLRNWSSDTGKFYVFNTGKMDFTDSFDLPYSSFDPQLSADGKYMFLPYSDKFSIVEMKSKTLVTQLNVRGLTMAVSPDNRYIAIFGDTLHILDAVTFAELYSEAITLCPGKFTQDGRRLYCPTCREGIYRLNLDTIPFASAVLNYPGYLPGVIAPSRDEAYLFVSTGVANRANYFEVYDLQRDSIIYSHQFRSWYALLNITPDGRYVIYAEVDSYGSIDAPPSPRMVSIFDAVSLTMRVIIPTYGINPECPDGISPDQSIITPDSKWFVSGGYGIIAINLNTLTAEKVYEFPDKFTVGITCMQMKR
jgi:hypothetical protein